MAHKDIRSARAVILGGGTAGIIAGVVMALFAMFYAGVTGAGFWLPVRNIAALLYGVDALILGSGAILIGILIHTVVAAVWGVAFAAFAPEGPEGAAVTGIAWGLLIWLFMTFAVLPVANPVMSDRVALNPGWWFALHVIFGVALMITPGLRRQFALPVSERAEEALRAA